MLKFFSGVINDDILVSSRHIFENLERDRLRSLRSNLRRNDRLRCELNEGRMSVEELLGLTHEDLADEETKKRREQTKHECLRESIRIIKKLNPDEIHNLINKVEDP